MDNSDLTWRKSTYSGGNGGNCIEVGVWRKASHSGGNGGECVEVAKADTEVAVRDSRNPNGPRLSFTPSAWHAFMTRNRTVSRPEQDLPYQVSDGGEQTGQRLRYPV